jgi:hypothetical protein
MGYTRDKKTGLYNIKGNTYEKIRGSRTQVVNGTAYMTTGELTKNQLVYSKEGYIVSKKKHITAKKEMRLEKYGYFTKKGKFGSTKRRKSKGRSRSHSMKGGGEDEMKDGNKIF